jgi:hypothetical protein
VVVTARAVVTGPLHRFTEADDAMVEAANRQLIGVPLVELFAEPDYQHYLKLYDWARDHQDAVAFVATAPNGIRGIVTLIPLPADRLEVDWEPVVSLPHLRIVGHTPSRLPLQQGRG